MKNELWQAVYAVFNELEDLREKFSHFTQETDNTDPLILIETDQKKLKQLVSSRKDLRSLLMQLKATMADHLSEREVYLSLFPIVVYIDEAIQMEVFQVTEQQWSLLQKELFDIEDGGVLFYDSLDDALRQPETLPFILEVFYLCINSGFKGKYCENPTRLNSYKEIIRNRIPQAELTEKEIEYKNPLMIQSHFSSLWYYAGAIVASVLIYAVFLIRGGSN
jgi:type IV/VI secretion system ImpK/VasF family protein